MATGKAQKKDKLRHAEYYDFQEIQDMLYADSNKGKEYSHLHIYGKMQQAACKE